MNVADSDGEGVGGVGRLRRFVEVEEAGDHELHLLLGRQAVADDGALDGEWRVLGDGEAGAGCSEQGDTAHLAELERALGVGGEEYFFDGDDLGLPELQELAEFGVDLQQPNRGPVLLVEADGASAERAKPGVAEGVIELDDTVAGELRSAVDAEDAHAYESIAGSISCHQGRGAGIQVVMD